MILSLREISRPPSDEDVQLLWDLLEERPSWSNISHPGAMPDWGDHYSFVASNGNGYYAHWWIIESRTNAQKDPFFEQLGSIYMTNNDELGIAILGSKQNKGYATWAILKVIEMFPGRDLLANVAPTNERSKSMFQGLGFSKLQETYVLRGS